MIPKAVCHPISWVSFYLLRLLWSNKNIFQIFSKALTELFDQSIVSWCFFLCLFLEPLWDFSFLLLIDILKTVLLHDYSDIKWFFLLSVVTSLIYLYFLTLYMAFPKTELFTNLKKSFSKFFLAFALALYSYECMVLSNIFNWI